MQRNIFAAVALATLICSGAVFGQPDTVWTRELLPHGEAPLVFEAYDGGILLVVNQRWGDTVNVIKLIKFSATGDSLWAIPVELPAPQSRCVVGGMYGNGDLFLTGWVWELDIYSKFIVRIDQEGNTVWVDTLPSDRVFPFLTAIWLPDSSMVAVSDFDVPDSTDLRITRVSVQGDTLWQRYYAFSGETSEIFTYNVLTDGYGRTFVVGYTGFWTGDTDGIILCLDANGDTIWTYRTLGECTSYWGELAPDAGVLIAAERTCDDDYWLQEYDHDGQLVWRRSYLTPDGDPMWPMGVRIAQNGGYFAAGYSTGEGRSWIVRIANNGDLLWTVPGRSIWYEQISYLIALEFSSGGFLLVETVERQGVPSPAERVLLTRYSPDTVSPTWNRPGAVAGSFSLHPNHPNPFNATTEISFDLPRAAKVSLRAYDVLGREAAQLVNGTLNAGTHAVNFDAAGLASGVYFYRIETENFVATRKMVLLK